MAAGLTEFPTKLAINPDIEGEENDLEKRQGVQSEEKCGDENAKNREHCNHLGSLRRGRMLEEEPDFLLKLRIFVARKHFLSLRIK